MYQVHSEHSSMSTYIVYARKAQEVESVELETRLALRQALKEFVQKNLGSTLLFLVHKNSQAVELYVYDELFRRPISIDRSIKSH